MPNATYHRFSGSRPAHRAARPVNTKRASLWLFFLFATYGPSVNIIGELRYTEILLLVLLVHQASSIVRGMGRIETVFVLLFFLSAFAQILSDTFHAAPIDGTLKRSGTYIVLALLLLATRHLVRGSPRRLQFIVAGYCLSYLIVYLFGIPVVSRHYHLLPWRLGLGTATTLLLSLFIVAVPRLGHFRGPLLVAMALVHFFEGSRAIGMVVLASGVLTTLAQFVGRPTPMKITPGRFLSLVALSVVGIVLAYQALVYATDNGMFSGEVQKKMEAQLNSPVGLFASSRPDTATALYAISKRPITGYGTGQPDAEINAYYAVLSASGWYAEDNYEDVLKGRLNKGFDKGIPSHSHIFSAWVEGGILAIWSWVFTLGVCLYIVMRCVLWKNSWAQFFILVAGLNFWDVIFSPGPTRVDMAIRLVVLIFALDVFRHFDQMNGRHIRNDQDRIR